MGSLKLPIELAGTTTADYETANYPLGRMAVMPTVAGDGEVDVAVYDGGTPGGARLRSYKRNAAGAVRRNIAKRLQETVSAKDFGAVGDGVTDDTAALQAFVTYLTANHCHGFMPAGNYLISAKIDFKRTYGWGIRGAGTNATTITQNTDNVPIFDLGAIAGDQLHSYVLMDLGFNYTNVQSAANTMANCIRFSQMGYQGTFHRLSFFRGSWAIGVAAGIGGPWGQDWDDLLFGGWLTGGAMDWTGVVNAVPNNKWGRFFVDGQNMVGPVFQAIKGYNWTIGAIEMLSLTNAQWFAFQAGTQVHINTVKLELARYNAALAFAGNALIYAPSSDVRIGHVFIGGNYAEMNALTSLSLVSGGAAYNVCIDLIVHGFSTAPTNFYWSAIASGRCKIGRIFTSLGDPAPLTNIGGSTAANFLTYDWETEPRVSDNIGDADYTTSHGSAKTIIAETLLTAPRTIEIMPDTNYLFNGKRYRIISRGAVNGANTLVIKAGGNTKATISADNYAVDLMWRRHPVGHSGWVIVAQGAA